MTVESLSAHIRPPELSELKMFDCREENNSARDSSFHDYARPNNNTKSNKIMNIHNMMISQPLVIIPDHSLAMDSGTSAYSPGGGLMYEADPMDSTRALLSPSASEAQPSPMSSFRKDSLETLYQLEEESIDLTACTNNSYWGQIDGPPIQDYLADISSDTDWYQLVRLVDSPNEFEMKTAAVRDKNSDNLNSAPLQVGLKNEDSPGPTLAQLNDKDCVLDRKPLMGLTCQSWSSLAGGNIAQQEGGSSTNVTAGWKSACPVSVSVPTPVTSQMNPVVSAAAPLGGATLVNSKGVRPLQSDVQSDIKSTSLASLLSVNMSSDSALSMSANGTRQRQNPFMGVLPADPPSQSTHAGNLQELLGLVTEVVQATDQKPASELPKSSNKFATTGGKWKNSDASGGTSMERKWEEIRKYIDSNTKLEEGMLADEAKQSAKHRETVKRAQEQAITEKELPAKKFKVEVQEVSDVSPEDDDDDSDYGNSDDDFSEIDSDCSYSSFIEDLRSGNRKEKRYFWQYNTQSKGPKGKRLCKSMQERDPHCLADFEDPVFQPDCQDARYKHNGKARKGDGNDITPSPLKLFQIGNELLKLNKKINSIGVNIPVKTKDGVKSKSRREKNKFASRACRLKKKAQHEANKLKLFGLEEEHRQLMDVLRDIKREISFRMKMGKITEGGGFVQLYEKIIKTNLTVMVAGNTADYVNTVLERVASGDKTGGILLHRHGIQ